MYKQHEHGVRDLPQVDCLPDNILLQIRIFIPDNRKVQINLEYYHAPEQSLSHIQFVHLTGNEVHGIS